MARSAWRRKLSKYRNTYRNNNNNININNININDVYNMAQKVEHAPERLPYYISKYCNDFKNIIIIL